jgi:CubicO group peptidase (beta-lactamase class C family)
MLNAEIAKAILVEKRLARQFSDDQPGGVVLMAKDGVANFISAHGLANRKTKTLLTPQHALHLASVGKQFTGVALLMLTELGKLTLDDPAGKHLPELKHYGNDFTLRRLLHHTSGIPDYYDDEALSTALFKRAKVPTNRDALAVLAEEAGPWETPGETFSYSNSGYDLLGLLVERVSGQPFPQFLEKNIFGPLGMRSTFSLPDEKRRKSPLVSLSYTQTGRGVEAIPDDPLDKIYGAGSVYATVEDLLLYDEALYQGRLVQPGNLAQAFTSGRLNNGEETGYGFGWYLEDYQGEHYYSHSGSWLAFSTAYLRFPRQHLCLFVLLNHDFAEVDASDLALDLAKIYL